MRWGRKQIKKIGVSKLINQILIPIYVGTYTASFAYLFILSTYYVILFKVPKVINWFLQFAKRFSTKSSVVQCHLVASVPNKKVKLINQGAGC